MIGEILMERLLLGVFLQKTSNKWLKTYIFLLYILFISLSCASGDTGSIGPAPEQILFTGWETVSPESQGMDSSVLADMVESCKKKKIHSVIVIKNGKIVSEFYTFPGAIDKPHSLYSTTKSITSALVGIALDKGYIKNVDQPIWDFFPEFEVEKLSAMKQRITLKDLLTMSSGFRWNGYYTPVWNRSADPVGSALRRDMAVEAGSVFNYDNAGSHLLSALAANAVGGDLFSFAEKYLFNPLGITGVTWYQDENGVPWGPSFCYITTRDMAKFGLLYLNNGVWNGKQVLSAQWVRESWTPHQNTNYNFIPHYGYQWWISGDKGYYSTQGMYGQTIIVYPGQNLVVAGTAFSGHNDINHLVDTYVIPSIKNIRPLEENSGSLSRLRELEKVGTKPAEQVEVSTQVTENSLEQAGRTYRFNRNTHLFWERCSFNFNRGTDEAEVDLDGKTALIGLDGTFRYAPARDIYIDEYYTHGFRGYWKNDTTFVMDIISEFGLDMTVEFLFQGDTLIVYYTDPLGARQVFYGTPE